MRKGGNMTCSRRGMRMWLRVLLVPFLFVALADASLHSGFTVGRQFEFLGKFCFVFKPTLREVAGHITGQVGTDVSGVQLAIYDDEPLFWEYIMRDNNHCDCACKLSPEHTKQVYNITPSGDFSVPFEFDFPIHEHIRPRFWYVALARCVPSGENFSPTFSMISEIDFHKYYFSAWYDIHMTQADGDELPIHEEGLPIIYGTLTLVAGTITFLQMVAARGLQRAEGFHPIVKLLTLVVGVFAISNVLFFFHFALFAINGIGVPLFNYVAQIAQVFVRVGTILLAMLVAKGWTINAIILNGQEKLSSLIVVILALYLSMAMWYMVWLDPASTLYIYDSWPGVGICALQLGVLVWFVTTLLETRAVEETSAKRRFFIEIGAVFAIYIISLPVIVLIASVLSPWVREKIVTGVSGSVDICVYTALVFVLWPSRAPRYFERLYSISSSAEKATLREKSNLPTEQL